MSTEALLAVAELGFVLAGLAYLVGFPHRMEKLRDENGRLSPLWVVAIVALSLGLLVLGVFAVLP